MDFFNITDQIEKIKTNIDFNIQNVIRHRKFILGPEVNQLEKKLSKYVNVKYCLTVSSGTDALLMSLLSLNIKPGDEVITTAFSYISAAEVIVRVGAVPIFVDVHKNNCLINENLIENMITKKTKAIIPVSLFGQMPNFEKINNIANRNGNIPVIEDAAQSFGASYKKNKSCSSSLISCTSFFPTKPLSSFGDGGAIFTNNRKIFLKLKALRVHGQTKKKYEHSLIGLSARMDTIQSAIVLSKLKIFNKEIILRNKIADKYNKAFKSLGIKYIQINNHNKSVYAVYSIFVKNRKKIIELMLKDKIPYAIYYPKPINKQKPYKKYSRYVTKNSNLISKTILSLPMGPYLKNIDQNKIIKFFQKNIDLC